MAYLCRMRKMPGICFLLLITMLSFSGLAYGKQVPVNTGKAEQSQVLEQRQLPNAELERVQVTTPFLLHASLKKSPLLPGQAITMVAAAQKPASAWPGNSDAVKAAKAYLFHIHPTHSHW